MDSTKRKVSHNYNLRSKSRRTRIQSQRNDDDASSSNNHEEASNQHSENTTQQRHSRERRKRSITQNSSSVSGDSSHSPASKRSKDASEDIKCIICLDTVNDRQMKFIRCGHGFHKKCCNNWLSVNDACPVCRTVVGRRRRRNTISLEDLTRERIIDDTPISDIIYFFTLSVFRT